jgi:hypothetical protein
MGDALAASDVGLVQREHEMVILGYRVSGRLRGDTQFATQRWWAGVMPSGSGIRGTGGGRAAVSAEDALDQT